MNKLNDYKLSLSTAILINVNIMLGAGIFINTPILAQRAEGLSGSMYLLVAILMLPLILSIAKLLRLHPSGGFYTFAQKEIHPFAGFLSGWSYFTAKLASCILMVHASVMLLQHIFPLLAQVHSFLLDFGFIALFSILNLLNLKAGSAIQKMFVGFKTFPLLFAIASCLFLFQSDNFSSSHLNWEGIPSSLPLVIYAVVGFEAACSMSSKIKDPQRNAPLAILISFAIVIVIAILYQSLFYGALGQLLVQCESHCDTFPALLNSLFGSGPWVNKLEGILHLAIASSTLGAAYGIIFSNCWNLHILAEKKHLWFADLFAKFNKNAIPFACVIAEGSIALIYLVVSQGVLVPLQQISALGCVVAYTFSVGALLQATKNNPEASKSKILPILGLGSCSILATACIRNFFLNGMESLVVYLMLLSFGSCMFLATAKKQQEVPIVDQ